MMKYSIVALSLVILFKSSSCVVVSPDDLNGFLSLDLCSGTWEDKAKSLCQGIEEHDGRCSNVKLATQNGSSFTTKLATVPVCFNASNVQTKCITPYNNGDDALVWNIKTAFSKTACDPSSGTVKTGYLKQHRDS